MKLKTILRSACALIALAIGAALLIPVATCDRSLSPLLKTQALFAQVSQACRAYRTEYGALPSSSENYVLTAILNGNNPRQIQFISFIPGNLSLNNEITDKWGTPIRIKFLPDQVICFVSAGKDKTFNTNDDIKDKK